MHERKKSRFWTYILALLFIYSSYKIYSLNTVLSKEQAQNNNVQKKISEEKDRKIELEKEKEAINSDEYMEKIAREKLGLVKKGEKVFIDINK